MQKHEIEHKKLDESDPHVGKARAALKRLKDAGYDTGELEYMVEELADLQRSDYEDAEEYADVRLDTWGILVGVVECLELDDSLVL